MAYLPCDRNETTFLPPCVADYVGAEDPVRAYDAFVEALDFAELGIPEVPGGNADEYSPRVLMKILVYGPAYGVRSSRQLERACHHNLSFMWLAGGLQPDFRTIGRFRRNNTGPLKKVLKQCVRMCIKLDLVDGNVLFMDGTGIRANAGIKNSWDVERCDRHIKKIEERIDRLVDGDAEGDLAEERKESLVRLKEELKSKEQLKAAVEEFAKSAGQKRLNTTDQDSVTMKTRQGTHASHNAQVLADGKHGLVVAAEVVADAADANHLKENIDRAAETLGKRPPTACADAGYFSLDDLAKESEETVLVVPSQKQVHEERTDGPGMFDKDRFRYDEGRDVYICPTEQTLVFMGRGNRDSRRYQTTGGVCQGCQHFGICTKNADGRTVNRENHEKLKEKLNAIYESPVGKAVYRLRQQIIEPVFGHWKQNLAVRQFLLRGQSGVNAELSILSTGFNIVRLITILGGVEAFIEAIKST